MYSTGMEIYKMFKEETLSSILGDEEIHDKKEKKRKFLKLAEDAIADADAEIDGYLVKRYKLPFRKVPNILNKLSKDIAAYNMISRKGIDEGDREKNFLNRYRAAISFLTNVAKGIVDIGEEESSQSASNSGMKIRSNNRLFSRDSMRGL